ncbi:MAG: hypothetical protein WD403_14455 [Pirellulales bacterium]
MTKVSVWAALLMLSVALGCDSGKPAAPRDIQRPGPANANRSTEDSRQAPDNAEQAGASAPVQQQRGPALGEAGRGAAADRSDSEEPAGSAPTQVIPDDDSTDPDAQTVEPGGQTLRGLGSAVSRALGKTLAGGRGAQDDNAADVAPPEDDPFPEGEPDDPQIEEPQDPGIEE